MRLFPNEQDRNGCVGSRRSLTFLFSVVATARAIAPNLFSFSKMPLGGRKMSPREESYVRTRISRQIYSPRPNPLLSTWLPRERVGNSFEGCGIFSSRTEENEKSDVFRDKYFLSSNPCLRGYGGKW